MLPEAALHTVGTPRPRSAWSSSFSKYSTVLQNRDSFNSKDCGSTRFPWLTLATRPGTRTISSCTQVPLGPVIATIPIQFQADGHSIPADRAAYSTKGIRISSSILDLHPSVLQQQDGQGAASHDQHQYHSMQQGRSTLAEPTQQQYPTGQTA